MKAILLCTHISPEDADRKTKQKFPPWPTQPKKQKLDVFGTLRMQRQAQSDSMRRREQGRRETKEGAPADDPLPARGCFCS